MSVVTCWYLARTERAGDALSTGTLDVAVLHIGLTICWPITDGQTDSDQVGATHASSVHRPPSRTSTRQTRVPGVQPRQPKRG